MEILFKRVVILNSDKDDYNIICVYIFVTQTSKVTLLPFTDDSGIVPSNYSHFYYDRYLSQLTVVGLKSL